MISHQNLWIVAFDLLRRHGQGAPAVAHKWHCEFRAWDLPDVSRAWAMIGSMISELQDSPHRLHVPLN